MQNDGASVNESRGQIFQPSTEADDGAVELIASMLTEGREKLGESTCRDTELGEDGVSGAKDVAGGAYDVNIIRGLRGTGCRGSDCPTIVAGDWIAAPGRQG